MGVRVSPHDHRGVAVRRMRLLRDSTGPLQPIERCPAHPELERRPRAAGALFVLASRRSCPGSKLFCVSFIVPCAGPRELPCEHLLCWRASSGRSSARSRAHSCDDATT